MSKMQQARQLHLGNRVISPVKPGRSPGRMLQPGGRLRKIKLLFILLSCFMLSLVVVAQYSALIIYNYQLSGARAELTEIKERSGALELEAAQLGTIGRIELIAREELGMGEPEIGQLRILTARQGEGYRVGE